MNDKPIFSDTDCLSCFIAINRTDILEQLYEYITIPIFVYNEFNNAYDKTLIQKIDKLINKEFIIVKDLETEEEIDKFLKYKKGVYTRYPIGNGEASALALAKIYNGIITSNNTRDVITIVRKENIEWMKTGDILEEAIDKNIIEYAEANKMWQEMLENGRHLGKFNTITEYLENKYNKESNV